MSFLRIIPKLLPHNLRERLFLLARMLNVRNPESMLSIMVLCELLLSLAGAALVYFFLKWNFFLVSVALFATIFSSVYLYLVVLVDQKIKLIEEILPDALQLMSSNLRAGISIEKSLILAARPEFGPLEIEINRVAKEVATGKDFGQALKDMSLRIKSKSLERVVELIISGLRSGGSLSSLLENSAEDLRVQKLVKEKIKSNVEIYIIFIFIAAGIGAPILFALSLFLVKVMILNFGSIEIPSSVASTLPITIGKIRISPDFILKYIIISLLTSSVLSSFMLGMIAKGKAKEGAKYIIVLAALSISLFFLGGFLLKTLFAGLFGIS